MKSLYDLAREPSRDAASGAGALRRQSTLKQRLLTTPITVQGALAYTQAWPEFEPMMKRFARLVTPNRSDREILVEEAQAELWHLDPSRFDFTRDADRRYVRGALIVRMWEARPREPKRLLSPEAEVALEIVESYLGTKVMS
ncbi:MAG: hypothetical protein ABJE47_23330 [bacterium]